MLNQHNDSGSVIEIVLTFDDGPHAGRRTENPRTNTNRTQSVMNVLKSHPVQHDMKGIFFIQTHSRGAKDDAYFRGNTTVGKALIREMHERQHIIGVHSGHDVPYRDHIPHTERQEVGELGNDIENAELFIEAVLKEALQGKPYLPKLIRPVKGHVNPDVVRTYAEKFYKLTMWDVDSEDSRPGATIEKVKRALVRNTWIALAAGKKRLIVLFHDTDNYVPQGKLEESLEAYIGIIKATVEGNSNVLFNGFGLNANEIIANANKDLSAAHQMKSFGATGLSPMFVTDRERVVEIVRWKYWDEQDGYVGNPPKRRE